MRVSVLKNDPGYDPRAPFASVYLDGEEQKYCLTADDEVGYVLRHVCKDGKLQHDGVRLLTEEVRGKVEIRIVESTPAPKRQAGFDQVELAIGVVVLILIAAAVWWHHSLVARAHDDAVEEGRKAALLEVAKRDNEQLVAAQQKIAELEGEKAMLEAAHRARMAQIDQNHEKELRDVHAEKDRIVACLRDPGCRVRYLGKADASCPAGGHRVAAAASGAAGERDAPPPGEPARAVVGDEDEDVLTAELLSEGDEAIADLTACQAIVLDDRRRVRDTDQTETNGRGGTMR